jgi:hypothetical protein
MISISAYLCNFFYPSPLYPHVNRLLEFCGSVILHQIKSLQDSAFLDIPKHQNY